MGLIPRKIKLEDVAGIVVSKYFILFYENSSDKKKLKKLARLFNEGVQKNYYNIKPGLTPGIISGVTPRLYHGALQILMSHTTKNQPLVLELGFNSGSIEKIYAKLKSEWKVISIRISKLKRIIGS